MTKEAITTLLAIWGALVSTVALIWNIFRSLKDRGRIRVSANITSISRNEFEKQDTPLSKALLKNVAPEAKAIDRLRITLFNTGKRPITVIELRMIYSEKGQIPVWDMTVGYSEFGRIFTHDFPKVLSEGEYHIDELSPHIVDDSLTAIYAKDAKGYIYTLPKKELRRLKDQAIYSTLTNEEKKKRFVENLQKRRRFWNKFRFTFRWTQYCIYNVSKLFR